MCEYFNKMSSPQIISFIGCFLLALHGVFVAGQKNKDDLWDRISANTDLSEFYGLFEQFPDTASTLKSSAATVFVPTNEAFQRLKNQLDRSAKDEYLLNYHMCNIPYKLEQLPGTGGSISTLASGNPALWVTRNASGHIFINNALINQDLSYSTNQPNASKRKVSHIISEVLLPLRLKIDDVTKFNPNAFGLLDRSDNYQLPYGITVFTSAVRNNEKENLFRDRGPNTYLIPINEGLLKKSTSDAIDSKVIDAHVIPDRVLFLNPTSEYEIFRPTAFTDLVKVTISFPFDPSSGKRYVRSDTLVGDRNHTSGVVLSEIIAANLPVSNGVVHLIKQPLMIIDKTIQEYIDENADGPISIFKQKLQYASALLRSKLNQNGGVTLFIPSNAAWKNENVEKVVNNVTLLENILNLHLVSEKITVSGIADRGAKEVNTFYVGKKLYFNVIVQGTNRTLTVEGGGVNATVLHSDIAATNGVIHIIDRVLGIPYATVGRKVATDPMLNITHTLGKYQNFNNRLDDVAQNYTFFAPRDVAWHYVKRVQPNLYDDLMIPVNAYSVLERHLVVSGNFTMAELKKIANSSYVLPAANGALTIRVREDDNKGYSIEWNGEWVPVYRPDVRCTNGIIHIIDKVLVTPKDINVHVGGAPRVRHHTAVLMIASLLLPLFAFFNYHLSSPIF